MMSYCYNVYLGAKRLSARKLKSSSSGFTLMEVVVSVTIFAGVITLMLSMFNYTLRIYRRVEAQRQVAQSVRTTMEFLTKEIRNGTVDYSVDDGATVLQPIAPCMGPGPSVSPAQGSLGASSYSVSNTAQLGLVNLDGERECIYWLHDTDPTKQEDAANNNLMIKKEGATAAQINPPGVKFKDIRFYVHPLRDPYTLTPNLVEMQPVVTIVAIVSVRLPTGEIRVVPYQTSVSTYAYDIPTE